jgi:glutamate N-acetyltransferase / amino-acid N-acetyltransferase
MEDNIIKGWELIENGSITSVPGFLAGSSHCGLKSSKKKFDICILYSPDGCICGGVFTKNKFKAAPVVIDQEILNKGNIIKAVVVNSGVANACTGKEGMENALLTIKLAGQRLGIGRENILVASTGVIGAQLPMDKIKKGIVGSAAKLDFNGGSEAASAIMTTDKVEKEIAISRILHSGNKINIGGIAKGSGMIEPDMATMLAFIATDVSIEKKLLDKTIKNANKYSFNSITVDGCQSTNDMVIVMANGKSGIKIEDENDKNYRIFSKGLFFVMEELAKKIVMDGEGATKFIEIIVERAPSNSQAKKAAFKIANSNLFKTAIFGRDLNWGRIVAALGSSGCDFYPEKLDIYLNDIKIVYKGIGLDIEKSIIKNIFKERELYFRVDLKNGRGHSKVWSSDLSFDYIKINAMYHN